MGDKELILTGKLKELNFGDWENRPWSEVPREELDAWARMPLDFTVPGGESPRDLKRRVDNWARGFAPGPGDLIIAHAGSLRALAAFILNTEFETTWQWSLPYATPVRVIDIHSGFIPETAPTDAV